MRSIIAISALFAASAVATPNWGFWAHGKEDAAETPCSTDDATLVAAISASSDWSDWSSATDAPILTETTPWAPPAIVSPTVAPISTSVSPPPAPPSNSPFAPAPPATTVNPVAPVVSPYVPTSVQPSQYTGAATANMAGAGALALAGLAFML